jgi:hypothetical protein
MWVLLIAAVAIVATILLAAGLRDLELSQGQLLPRYKETEEVFYTPDMPPSLAILGYLYVGLYYLFLVLLPVSIIYVLVSSDARKRILRSLGLLMWIIAFYVLLRQRPEFLEQLSQQGAQAAPYTELLFRDVEFVASPPTWLIWAVTLPLAALVATGLVALAWYLWRRAHPPASPLERLGQEARQAVDALQAGADLKDTVMRCYFEMSRVLGEQMGLVREQAMTPREFESSLAQAGLPDEQVQRLTRLFEDVRYGAKPPGRSQEAQALDCLTAVVRACGGEA